MTRRRRRRSDRPWQRGKRCAPLPACWIGVVQQRSAERHGCASVRASESRGPTDVHPISRKVQQELLQPARLHLRSAAVLRGRALPLVELPGHQHLDRPPSEMGPARQISAAGRAESPAGGDAVVGGPAGRRDEVLSVHPQQHAAGHPPRGRRLHQCGECKSRRATPPPSLQSRRAAPPPSLLKRAACCSWAGSVTRRRSWSTFRRCFLKSSAPPSSRADGPARCG